MGKTLVWRHCDNPQKLWFEHQDYQKNSSSSVHAGHKIVQELYGLTVKDFPLCHAFIKCFDSLIQNYNKITTPPMNGNMNFSMLQFDIAHDKCLTTTYATLKQTKIAVNNTSPLTYMTSRDLSMSSYIGKVS